MKFSDHDLLQMDSAYLESLDSDRVLTVAKKLLADLKESRERLNQNSQNSSVPPSSRPAYLGIPMDKNEDDENDKSSSKKGKTKSEQPDDLPDIPEKFETIEEGRVENNKESNEKESEPNLPKRKAGKQIGAPGYGRTQVIPPHILEIHRATQCAACESFLPSDSPFSAKTGFYVIDLKEHDDKQWGIEIVCTLHHYGETKCSCGHSTLLMPNHEDHNESTDSTVNTRLSEWRLIGPRLASFIVFLTFRMRLSRTRVQEFLREWLGLHLATGTIDNCIRESALAAFPIYLALLNAIPNEPLVNVDETPWCENGTIPWLWVFISSTIVLFVIGKRQKEVVLRVLTASFLGWLMSDGLKLYRTFLKRLRCLAHLVRKARGLAESLTEDAREFGEVALFVLESVFDHRFGTCSLETLLKRLATFRGYCEEVVNEGEHKKTAELAKEFLNDWDAIWRIIEHPELPATNNTAERILRHWVIARQISHGTRTSEGSQAVAILASIIETCRLRGVKTWDYLSQVIAKRRKGEEPLPIPMPSPEIILNNMAVCPCTASANGS